MKRKILFLIMSFCILMLDMCWIQYFQWYYENKHQNKIMAQYQDVSYECVPDTENLVDDSLVNPPLDLSDRYYQYIQTPFLETNFTELKKQNEDVVAWIRVSGTEINYPVVQTHDNEYYLTHSFDHSSNKAGWIFSDFRNNLFSLNANTIFYGHRRNDGSMFGSLKNVLTEKWLQNSENYVIQVSTLKENMLWQVFSVYEISKESYYITTHFADTLLYQEFLDTLLDRSFYDFHTALNVNDKILTLSTCKDGIGIERVVLHAKLIKKETRSS